VSTERYYSVMDRWPILVDFLTAGQFVDFKIKYNNYIYNPFNAYHAETLLDIINNEEIDAIELYRESGIVPEHLKMIDLKEVLQSVYDGELNKYFDHEDVPPEEID